MNVKKLISSRYGDSGVAIALEEEGVGRRTDFNFLRSRSRIKVAISASDISTDSCVGDFLEPL
jgi:hypothetical protein